VCMRRAMVCFSGGQDSATCLYLAASEYDEVHAVAFDYGQRHVRELQAARTIAQALGVSLTVLPCPTLARVGGNSLVDSTLAIQETAGLPNTFVPGRNLLFLTLAAGLYMSKWPGESVELIAGMSEADYSGYPDCREETIRALQQTLSLGMGTPVTIRTPLMHRSKKQTVELARTLPGCWEALKHSVTCYEGQSPGCKVCPSCKLRRAGFEQAGYADPAEVLE